MTFTAKQLERSLFFGLITGAIFSVYVLLLYLLGVNLFGAFAIVDFIVKIAFIVVLMVKGIKEINKIAGQPLSYGKKYLISLIIGFIGLLIYSIIYYLIFFVVDPETTKEMIDNFIIVTEERLIRSGLSDSMIEKQMSRIVAQMDNADNFANFLLSSILTPALIGLIVAASVNTKRYNQEKFEDINEEIN